MQTDAPADAALHGQDVADFEELRRDAHQPVSLAGDQRCSRLETLAYRHLLDAEPTDVNRTVEEITAAIGSWITGDSPTASAAPGTAAELLEQITYHHVLHGDPGNAVRVADRTAEILGPWLDELSGNGATGASLGW